ncbi:MAG: alpha-L-fucosidase [Bacteroidales bacterium]|nr:alpha-L-fucosidase [Bacteroidales bacterium]
MKTYDTTWESLDSRPIPGWFTDARFGIFIHWGVYSVPAWRPISSKKYASYAEWYYARVIGDTVHGGDAFHKNNYGVDFEYRDFAPMFRAELFDPDAWANLFYRSGAKYVVLTSKHHDGYCLWPTKSRYKKGWNSMDMGPERDLVGELAKAVRKRGLKFGIYYSLPEWESTPTKRTQSGYWLDKQIIEKYQIPQEDYVEGHVIPQLKEVVMQYHPSLIFSDGGEWDFGEDFWHTKEFLAWLYNEAPNKDEVVVNDRWAKGVPGNHGDYFSSEYEDTDAIGLHHPWEESRGIGGSYGFNRAENLEDYSTTQQLIHELIDIVSRGGNLLLNVGPTADGRIPVIMQERLVEIGDWLKINGECIFGTRPWYDEKVTIPGDGTDTKEPAVWFTTKGCDLYAICAAWPEDGLFVPVSSLLSPHEQDLSVGMIGVPGNVDWHPVEGGIQIPAPQITPSELPCSHAFVYKLTRFFQE